MQVGFAAFFMPARGRGAVAKGLAARPCRQTTKCDGLFPKIGNLKL
jgi:hypothetical protein